MDKVDKQFNKLMVLVKGHSDNVSDYGIVKKAWEFAKLAHSGQKRLTGDPYVSHSLETAKILAEWKLDIDSIVAGLLHDTIEDGGAKGKDIVDEFGEDIAVLVDGVTKVSLIKLKGSSDEEFVENLRKMFLAMAKDLRVVLVKLADRLHNMRTLDPLPPEKQERIAKETLEVFAPLAERLGMGEVKAQLDDLTFPWVYPTEYKKVKDLASKYYKKTRGYIKKMRRNLLRQLADEGIRAKIDGRKKHLYSLWRKLERPEVGWDFDKIHDIIALRIIVESVADCYTALGVVHSQYKPVPHLGVSDFIAQPKPNGYRSIHTKVFGPGDRIVEVQIRTHQMHKEAEYGVAAHWAYGEAKSKGVGDKVLEERGVFASANKLSWIKQLANWQREMTDTGEFMRAVKFDALSNRNFVFSPNGDVFDLPKGATPVDFAFAVHTDFGYYLQGAKVDGKIVPLDYKLKSGNVVEILKSKVKKKPNRDWLRFVVTNTARRAIKKSIKNKRN